MTNDKLVDGLYRLGDDIEDTKAPKNVPLDKVWQTRKAEVKLVNPANRRKRSIIVVGTGPYRRFRGSLAWRAGLPG